MASSIEDHEKIQPMEAVSSVEDVSSSDDDEVAPEAIGGTNADLPPGYYRSASFIGTVVVCIDCPTMDI